jgi:hypothetical protein
LLKRLLVQGKMLISQERLLAGGAIEAAIGFAASVAT